MNTSATYTYKHPRAAIASDIVVFGYDGYQLHILLIERGVEPYKGMWALPGGFMLMDETIEECARRELREETSVSGAYLRQFGVFSDIHRDPRGRVVTVAFLALVSKADYHLLAGDDASRAEWFVHDELPPLAFDHNKIINEGLKHLRDLIATRPVVLHLLDKRFSIAELQRLVETITGEEYDRRNLYSVRPEVYDDSDDDFCESQNCMSCKPEPKGSLPDNDIESMQGKRLSRAMREGLNFFKF